MKNNCSKQQAVELIKRAIASGWTREITTQSRTKIGDLFLYRTTVVLRGSVEKGFANEWAQVIVSFAKVGKNARWSVSLSTICDFNSDGAAGWWDANYQIKRLNEAKARVAARISAEAEEQANREFVANSQLAGYAAAYLNA